MKAFTKRALLLTLLVLCLVGVTILGASAAANVTAGVTEKVDGTTYVASFDFVEGETTTTYWYTDLAQAIAEATANSVGTVNVHADAVLNVNADMSIATALVVNEATVTIQGPASGAAPTVTYGGSGAMFTITKDANVTLKNVNVSVTTANMFQMVKAAIGTSTITLENVDVTATKALFTGYRETAGTLTITVNGGADLADPAKITIPVDAKMFDTNSGSTSATLNVTFDFDNVEITGELVRSRAINMVMTMDNCKINNAASTGTQGLFALFTSAGYTFDATFTNCDINVGQNYFNRKTDGAVMNFTFVNCNIANDGTRYLFHCQGNTMNFSITGGTLTSASEGKANAVFGAPYETAVTALNVTMDNVDASNTLAIALLKASGAISLTATLNKVTAPAGCYLNAAANPTVALTECNISVAGNMAFDGSFTAAELTAYPALAFHAVCRIGTGDAAVYYVYLNHAIAAASAGDTIYLLQSTNVGSGDPGVEITKSVTIEGVLNGNSYPELRWNAARGFKPRAGVNFTLKNLSVVQSATGTAWRFMDRPYGEGTSTTLPTNFNPGVISFYNVTFDFMDAAYFVNCTGGFYATFNIEDCTFTTDLTGDNKCMILFGSGCYAGTVNFKNCVFDGSFKLFNGSSDSSGAMILDGCTFRNNKEANFVQLQAGGKVANLTIKNSTMSNNGCADSNGAYFLLLYGTQANVTLENITWDATNTATLVGCLNAGNSATVTLKNVNAHTKTSLINLRNTFALTLNIIGGTYVIDGQTNSFIYTNDNKAFTPTLIMNINKGSDTTTSITTKGRTKVHDYNVLFNLNCATITAEICNTTFIDETGYDVALINNRNYNNDGPMGSANVKFVNTSFNRVLPLIKSATGFTSSIALEGVTFPDVLKGWELGAVARIGDAYYTNAAAAAADAEALELIAHNFYLNGVAVAVYLAEETPLADVALAQGAAMYYVADDATWYFQKLNLAVNAAPADSTIYILVDYALDCSTSYFSKKVTITSVEGKTVTISNGIPIPFVLNNGADVTFKNLKIEITQRLARIDGEVTELTFENCQITYSGDYFIYSNSTANDPETPDGGTPITKTMTVIFDENTVVAGTGETSMGIWINTAQITKNSRFIFKGAFSTVNTAAGALLFIDGAAAATMEIYPTAVVSGPISNPNGVLIYRVGGAVNDDNAKEYGVPLRATDATGVYYTNDYFFAFDNLTEGEKIYEVPLTAEHSDKSFNINNGTYTVNTANVVDFLFTMFPNLVRINEETYYANLGEAIAAYQEGDVIYILKDMVVIDSALIDGKAVVVAGLNLGTTDAPVYPVITSGVNVFAFANGGSLTLKNVGMNLSGGRVATITEPGTVGAVLFENVYFTWSGATTSADRQYLMTFNGAFATTVTVQNCVIDLPLSEKGIFMFFAANAEGGAFEIKNTVVNGGLMQAQGNAVVTVTMDNVSATEGRTQLFNLYGVKQIDIMIEDCNLNLLNNDAAVPGAALVYSGDASANLLVNVTVKNSYVASNSMNASAPYGAMFSINSVAGCQFNLVFEDSTLFQNHTGSYIVYAKNDQHSCATVRIDVTNCVLKSNAGIFVLKGTKNNADEIDNVVNFNEGTEIYASLVNNGVVVNTGGNSRINFNAPVTDGAKAPVVYAYGQSATISNINDGYIYWADGTTVLTIYDGEFVSTNGSDYLFAVTGESSLTVYKGYFEHNGYSCARAYGTTATMTIYGGTWILQPTHVGRASQSAMSVLEAGASSRTASLYIYGGIFVNNNDAELVITGASTSRQVIYKSTAGSTVVIEGGVFLATSVQDYFYYSVGNSGAGISIPVTSMPVLKGSAPLYNYAGRNFYLFSYNMGTPIAPELDASVTVRLYTDADGNASNGLRFTSSISYTIYSALIAWVENMAIENGLEANDYVLTFGTLIAPMNTLVEAGTFSLEAFAEQGISADQYVNIVATEKGMSLDMNGLEIRAALVNIGAQFYDTALTARPYVTVTLIDGGKDAAEGTTAVSSQTYYGAFNTSKGVSSISRAAQRELSDLMAVRVAPYNYKSITVAGAYSRYSKAQQEALLSFVAHEHNFNFKGECLDEGCEFTAADALTVDESTKIYCEYGGVSYATVALTKGITYNFAFSRNIVKYALYDANGNECAISDNKFACTTDGVYHLVITATGIGSTDLIVNHVHEADHTGYCSICEKALGIAIEVEQNFQQLVTDGMTYYYAIQLTGGVSYTVLTKNGYYTLYDAQGNVCEIVDGITFVCEEDGTYYLVVVATFSATGGVMVTHNHNYDYKGYCTIDYCDSYIGKPIVLYQQIGGLVTEGDEFRVSIELEAGKTYPIAFTGFMGVSALYNEAGEKLTLNNDGSFVCEVSGTYYLAVSVQADTSAYFYVKVEHDCEYNHKGICGICANNAGVTVPDQFSEADVELKTGSVAYYNTSVFADTYYQLVYPANAVEIKVYNANDELVGSDTTADEYFDPTTGIYYNKNADAKIYIVATVIEDATANIGFAHIHKYDFKGDCTVTNCGYTCATAIKTFNAELPATWVSGETYYYSFYLVAGLFYNVELNGIEGTWVIKNDQNAELFQNGATCFSVTEEATCYLIVTASADATGTIKISEAVSHALDFKAECTVEGCDYTACVAVGEFVNEAVEIDCTVEAPTIIYRSIVIEEGKTYTVAVSDANLLGVQVLDANGEAVALTEGAFTCEAGKAGTYYLHISTLPVAGLKVTVTRSVPTAPAVPAE